MIVEAYMQQEWNEKLWQMSSLQDMEKSCRDMCWDGQPWGVELFRFQFKGGEPFLTVESDVESQRLYSPDVYQELKKALKQDGCRGHHGQLTFGDFECVWSHQLGAIWQRCQVPDWATSGLKRELYWAHRLFEAETLIYQDDLTGLYNYRYLEMMLGTEMRRAARFGSDFSLIFLDVDNFKVINDTHGHLVGSEVLKHVARALNDSVREIDSVFRYGGDEYVVLALGADATHGLVIAERIRAAVANRVACVGEKQVSVTLSMGVAAYPDHGSDLKMLLDHADRAMYCSKHAGKNCVTGFVEEKHGFGKKVSKSVMG